MVVIRNDFPEYDKEVNAIAKELAFLNMIIVREPEDGGVFNKHGEIHIPDKKDKTFFCGTLVHEGGHSVFDPVTVHNYLKCLNEVKKKIRMPREFVMKIGNFITDILNEYQISRNKVLRKFRRDYLRKMFDEWYKDANVLQKVLWRYYNRIHGCKLPLDGKDVYRILKVVESDISREEKYVELARILVNIMRRERDFDLQNTPTDLPIKPSKEEMENVIKRILEESEDVDDAKNMIEFLKMGVGKVNGDVEGIPKTDHEILRAFYQAKSYECRIRVEYPKTPTFKGVRVGARKWRLSDGYKKLDIRRTIMKFGVNIPTVTSRTARVLPKFISNHRELRPVDIVISIDVSGSTGYPYGYMNCVADYEVVMLYALIDEAKRINQRVGLTLWSHCIAFTTLPDCYDYRAVDQLKDVPISGYWQCGGTSIKLALDQAEEYSDKLFMVFTDGDVEPDELKDVDNVVFFLVKPSEFSYKMFRDFYGADRVVRIDDIKDIPRVTLEWYRKVFVR
ncbi:MAG: vWA domain-containing protein [Candidatus Nezhaarchaeales archaeon]